MRGGERHVDVAGLADRLAAVERLGDRELAGALLQDPRDPEEVLRPLRGRDLGPAVLESVAGRLDGERDVLLPRLRDLEELLLARRGDRREPLARARLDLLAADEEAVALPDLDDVARLGGGRVLPVERDRGSRLALLDLSHQSMVK